MRSSRRNEPYRGKNPRGQSARRGRGAGKSFRSTGPVDGIIKDVKTADEAYRVLFKFIRQEQFQSIKLNPDTLSRLLYDMRTKNWFMQSPRLQHVIVELFQILLGHGVDEYILNTEVLFEFLKLWNSKIAIPPQMLVELIDVVRAIAGNPRFFPIIQEFSLVNMFLEILVNSSVKEALKEKIHSSINALNDKLREMEESQNKLYSLEVNANDPLISNTDFLNFNVFPPFDELVGFRDVDVESKYGLRPVSDHFGYSSRDELLALQIQLMREDFLRGLRSGVQQYIEQVRKVDQFSSSAVTSRSFFDRNSDIYLYHSIRFTDCVFTNTDGILMSLSFKVNKKINWAYSKRFMMGSLLVITLDDFQKPENLFWGLACERDRKTLKEGNIKIKLLSGSDFQETDFGVLERFLKKMSLFSYSGVILESAAFFLPYNSSIRAMCKIGESARQSALPFEPQIVHLDENLPETEYDVLDFSPILDEKSASLFRFEKLNPHLSQTWELLAKNSILDPSQLSALRLMLTKKLSLCQGPPGTGKT